MNPLKLLILALYFHQKNSLFIKLHSVFSLQLSEFKIRIELIRGKLKPPKGLCTHYLPLKVF